jgi:hypothetical protein
MKSCFCVVIGPFDNRVSIGKFDFFKGQRPGLVDERSITKYNTGIRRCACPTVLTNFVMLAHVCYGLVLRRFNREYSIIDIVDDDVFLDMEEKRNSKKRPPFIPSY